jgi:hypothetical protein
VLLPCCALQAMALNGSLQFISSLLMVGLAAWHGGWWCFRGRAKQQQALLREQQLPAGHEDAETMMVMPLVGGATAAMAAAMADEEPPGTIPDLAVELTVPAVTHLHRRKSVDSV